MIINRKAFTMAVGISVLLYTFGAAAGNGVVRGVFIVNQPVEPNPPYYVACLGETISTTITISYLYHEFDTPSGNYHYLDNWRFTWEIRGNSSGNVWFGRGASPYVVNMGPGATEQFGESFVAKPVTGKGPKIRGFYRFKLTVNANGEEVEFVKGYDPEAVFQCLGKP